MILLCFCGLVIGEVGVERHVPIGTHQDVTWVVREEVHDHVTGPTSVDDQPVLVTARRGGTERAAVARVRRRTLPLDVGHPVRSPQPLEGVGRAGETPCRLEAGVTGRRAHGHDSRGKG